MSSISGLNEGSFNSSKNIITLFVLGFLIFIFIIGMSVGNLIYEEVDNTLSITDFNGLNITNSTLYQAQKTAKTETTNIFYDAFILILYMLMGLTIYSSFVQKNSITSYFFSFIVSIIAGALIIYLMTETYNVFIVQTSMFDMTHFPYFFYDNFQILVIANIIAGILSFIFVKREVN